MKCPDCGVEYTEMFCAECAGRKSREAYLSFQGTAIARVLSGEAWLVLNRRTRSGPHHVALFGDPMHAYCGLLLDGPQQRTKKRYSTNLRQDLCAKCVEAFDAVVAREALAHGAAEAS